MANEVPWFERNLKFGHPAGMLPYFLERLEGTGLRIQRKVTGIPEKLLSTQKDGKWSVKQNIGHLAEVDKVANRRIDEMIKGISPMTPAVFEPKQDYNTWPVEKVIILFEETRRLNIAKYKSLTGSELLKASIHPRLKVPMTPVDLAWFDAEHDDHHLVKISGIISRLTSTN